MFRQSVRQAMKAITIELERMQCSRVMVSDTQRVAAQIGRVTQLIAEVMQKVHTVSEMLVGLLRLSSVLPDCVCHMNFYLRAGWTGVDFVLVVLVAGSLQTSTCIASRLTLG